MSLHLVPLSGPTFPVAVPDEVGVVVDWFVDWFTVRRFHPSTHPSANSTIGLGS